MEYDIGYTPKSSREKLYKIIAIDKMEAENEDEINCFIPGACPPYRRV